MVIYFEDSLASSEKPFTLFYEINGGYENELREIKNRRSMYIRQTIQIIRIKFHEVKIPRDFNIDGLLYTLYELEEPLKQGEREEEFIRVVGAFSIKDIPNLINELASIAYDYAEVSNRSTEIVAELEDDMNIAEIKKAKLSEFSDLNLIMEKEEFDEFPDYKE